MTAWHDYHALTTAQLEACKQGYLDALGHTLSPAMAAQVGTELAAIIAELNTRS